MKQYSWVVDLFCAVVGALLMWGLVSNVRSGLVWSLTGWLVSVSMVAVPFAGWLRGGISTTVAETATKYLAVARDVLRDRRAVYAVLAMVAVSHISSSLTLLAYTKAAGRTLESLSNWPHLARLIANVAPTTAARLLFTFPKSGGLPDPYFLSAAYLLALPAALGYLQRNRGQPGWSFSKWALIGLGAATVITGFMLPRAGHIIPRGDEPLLYLFGVLGQLMSSAARAAVLLFVWNAVLHSRTGRSVNWLSAFAGLYSFLMGIVLLNAALWVHQLFYTNRPLSPSELRLSHYLFRVSGVAGTVVSLATLFVPVIIVLGSASLRDGLLKGLRIWLDPWRVLVFLASQSVIVLPPLLVSEVVGNLVPPLTVIGWVLSVAAIPFAATAAVFSMAALGAFVLENAPERVMVNPSA